MSQDLQNANTTSTSALRGWNQGGGNIYASLISAITGIWSGVMKSMDNSNKRMVEDKKLEIANRPPQLDGPGAGSNYLSNKTYGI